MKDYIISTKTSGVTPGKYGGMGALPNPNNYAPQPFYTTTYDTDVYGRILSAHNVLNRLPQASMYINNWEITPSTDPDNVNPLPAGASYGSQSTLHYFIWNDPSHPYCLLYPSTQLRKAYLSAFLCIDCEFPEVTSFEFYITLNGVHGNALHTPEVIGNRIQASTQVLLGMNPGDYVCISGKYTDAPPGTPAILNILRLVLTPCGY